MTSAMKNPGRDLMLENESRPNETLSVTTTQLEHSLHECCLTDVLERDDICNGMGNTRNDINSRTQQTFHVSHEHSSVTESRSKSPPPRAMNAKRPLLQKKSYSDLGSYKDVHMKILVEGKEVLDTCLQHCPLGSVSSSPQEMSTDVDRVRESLQHEQLDTKRPAKFFAGWFTKKTQSKSQEGKNSEPPIGFRLLRRSRSFNGRIRDKIKNINPCNANHAVGSPGQQRSKYLQPPVFYKIIDLKDVNRDDHAFRTNYQRRHSSDQTDSLLRRPLGATQDMTANTFSTLSLERGIKQHTTSDKKLLDRKKNSIEKMFEFPFWSQITDANRSRSCNGRIRVSETHRDTNGMLETNLCSTEL